MDEGIFGSTADDFDGAATRFDFDEPRASGSDFLLLSGSDDGSGSLFGSEDGSLGGSGSLFGSEVGSGSLFGSGSDAGSEAGSLFGSLFGSLAGSPAGSLVGSELGSEVGSGSLAGFGAASKPISCNTGNFLHSAVNFFGLHPKPTHDVPFTTKTISISFCSFNIRQWILKSGVSVFVVYSEKSMSADFIADSEFLRKKMRKNFVKNKISKIFSCNSLLLQPVPNHPSLQ